MQHILLKSNFFLILEKIKVLSDEICFLYDICNYYSNRDNNEVLADSFKNLKADLETLDNVLSKSYENINNILEQLYPNKELDLTQMLYFVNKYQKDINKIITKLKLINEKTYQLFRDGYNQYIPKPTPGRMFSYINITSQVELSIEKRLKEFLARESQDIEVQIIWQYTKNYKIDEVDRDTRNKKSYYIRMSYWFFELPYLTPILTHEIGHFVASSEKYIKRFDNIKAEIIQNLYGKDNELIHRKEVTKEFIYSTINEVMADIIAFIHHGNAYIFTATHELLGYYLSDILNYTSYLEVSPWDFNNRRDNAYIRLYILVRMQEFFIEKNDEVTCDVNLFNCCNTYIKELKILLHIIYNKYDKNATNKTFKTYYRNWHNLSKKFLEVESVVFDFIESIYKVFTKNKEVFYSILNDKNKLDSQYSSYRNLPKHYNDMWKYRFELIKINNIPNKIEIRKKIHRRTLIKLLDNSILNSEDIKPYTLIFYKYKIDKINNNNLVELDNEIALGIYDKVDIIEEDSTSFPTKSKLSKEDIKYTLKFSIMKIMTDIIGKTNEKDDNLLNIITQIEVNKDLSSNDIYKNLYNDIKKINDFFKDCNVMNNFTKVMLFKSLGPKDLILKVENTNVDFIYKVKEFLSKEFNRTFTTITFMHQNNSDILERIKSETGHKLITEIRVKPKKTLKLPNELKDKINSVYKITGFMDYRIYWKSKTSIENIITLYKYVSDKDFILDIQTRFLKHISKNNLNDIYS